MAESVDALVSNTSGAIRAGSTPAQGTKGNLLTEDSPNFYRPLLRARSSEFRGRRGGDFLRTRHKETMTTKLLEIISNNQLHSSLRARFSCYLSHEF